MKLEEYLEAIENCGDELVEIKKEVPVYYVKSAPGFGGIFGRLKWGETKEELCYRIPKLWAEYGVSGGFPILLKGPIVEIDKIKEVSIQQVAIGLQQDLGYTFVKEGSISTGKRMIKYHDLHNNEGTILIPLLDSMTSLTGDDTVLPDNTIKRGEHNIKQTENFNMEIRLYSLLAPYAIKKNKRHKS